MGPTSASAGLFVFIALYGASALAAGEAFAGLDGFDCVVEPSAVVDLGAAVPGVLAETVVDRGDRVTRGDRLGQLESRLEEVGVRIAEAIAGSATGVDLRATTSAFGARTSARNERLAATSAVSEQALDQVRTEARIAGLQLRQERESQALAELELERARAQLARRELVSPIDGTVVQRFHDPGEYVDADPVYRIARLDPLHVEVIVPIEYLGQVVPGMRGAVTLTVPDFETRALEAIVERVDAVADAASASYGVRLRLDNPDLAIPSGVRCRIDFLAP